MEQYRGIIYDNLLEVELMTPWVTSETRVSNDVDALIKYACEVYGTSPEDGRFDFECTEISDEVR